jgi:hypothetical protein
MVEDNSADNMPIEVVIKIMEKLQEPPKVANHLSDLAFDFL